MVDREAAPKAGSLTIAIASTTTISITAIVIVGSTIIDAISSIMSDLLAGSTGALVSSCFRAAMATVEASEPSDAEAKNQLRLASQLGI